MNLPDNKFKPLAGLQAQHYFYQRDKFKEEKCQFQSRSITSNTIYLFSELLNMINIQHKQ